MIASVTVDLDDKDGNVDCCSGGGGANGVVDDGIQRDNNDSDGVEAINIDDDNIENGVEIYGADLATHRLLIDSILIFKIKKQFS